jgi:hypothetical protein
LDDGAVVAVFVESSGFEASLDFVPDFFAVEPPSDELGATNEFPKEKPPVGAAVPPPNENPDGFEPSSPLGAAVTGADPNENPLAPVEVPPKENPPAPIDEPDTVDVSGTAFLSG